MNQPDDPTRCRILDAAGAMFAERGFEKTTIRDICRRAEVNLASVNYHFGDKQRLYAATIRHAHELAATQVPLPEWTPGAPPEQKLRDFIRTMFQRMLVVQQLPWQAKLMMREVAQPTGVCVELAEDYIRPHFQILLGILGEMLPADMPPHRRHQLAFSIVGQAMFYRHSGPVIDILVPEAERSRHYTAAQLADHVTDLTLAALGRRPLFPSSAAPEWRVSGAAQPSVEDL